MFLLAVKKFLRSKIAVIGLSFILLAGICSIHIGKQFFQKQEEIINKTASIQQEHINRYVRFHGDEMGLLLYYLRFAYVNKPTHLSALSIGQRDVNTSIQSVTIRNLENQKYDTDLYNPFNLLLGNMDFSFVLIYLFPLLIIAFTYNILSEEKEADTWRLVFVQAKKPMKMLWQKLAIRAGAVYAALAIILSYAVVLLSLPVNTVFLSLVCLSVLYLAFWFALSYWVISWHKNSSVNAVSLLTFWVFFTIVCSALINNYLIYKYPVPEALSTVVEQREGYHEKWDMDKKTTMDKFFAHYPQFSAYSFPDKEFSWLWYYAMQQMGDDDAQHHASEMKEKLWLRDKVSNVISAFIPTLHTQQQLNNLSRSGLSNYLFFLEGTTRFHEKMRLYFYSKIFGNAPVKDENWEKWKVEYFEEEVKVNLAMMQLPLLAFLSILIIAGYLNFRKSAYQ